MNSKFLPPDCTTTTIHLEAPNNVVPVWAGWLNKLSVRRQVFGIPNAGRHVKNWKLRWFILYSNGDLIYFRHRDELNVDDLLDDTSSNKTLELRGTLQLNNSAVCVAHFYYEDSFCCPIQCNKDGEDEELIARASSQILLDDFISACNGIIGQQQTTSKLFTSNTSSDSLKDLASYVKRRLSLKHTLSESVTESESGSESSEARPPSQTQANPTGVNSKSNPNPNPNPIPPPSLQIVILVVGTRGEFSGARSGERGARGVA